MTHAPDGGPSLKDIETGIRALCFSPAPAFLADVPERPQEIYRRLVRNNLFGNIMRTIPVARSIVPDVALRALITRFLDERPPTVRFLRGISIDFVQWVQERAAAGPGPLADDISHAAFPELIHWEVAEVDVLQAPDVDKSLESGALAERPSDERTVEFHPSTRLLAYAHPVHRMKEGDAFPSASRSPSVLLAWRADERLKWRALQPAVARVLIACGEGGTLLDAFASADAGGVVDRGFVRSWLSNFRARGAIVGFGIPGAA